MKKSIISLIMMSLILMTTNSCSKSNPSSSGGICPFSKETIQGKTYSLTISKWIDSNGVDLTNSAIEVMLKDTCDRSYYTFKSDGSYVCNRPCDKKRGFDPEYGNWSVENLNNNYYLNLTNSITPFIEGLIKIESHDCNSFSIAGEFKGEGYFIIYKFIKK